MDAVFHAAQCQSRGSGVPGTDGAGKTDLVLGHRPHLGKPGTDPPERQLARRHTGAKDPVEQQIQAIAAWVVSQWDAVQK